MNNSPKTTDVPVQIVTTPVTKENENTIKKKSFKVETPFLRVFDLSDDSPNYILGYN